MDDRYNDKCSVSNCRKWANLTPVHLHLPEQIRVAGQLLLPEFLTIYLCPKHFLLRKPKENTND